MNGNVIIMSKAKLTYAIGLVSDSNSKKATTYSRSLSTLQYFLAANDGEYIGPLIDDNGQPHEDYAVVKMTKATEDRLHDKCISDLETEGSQPFVDRLEGFMFNIGLREGIKFCKDPRLSDPRPEITC